LRNPPCCLPFLALLILLPLPARSAVVPVGVPFAIVDPSACSSDPNLEVIANPQGDFEVIWVDDFDFVVKSRRFVRELLPADPPQNLMPLHGGLFFLDLSGASEDSYELAMNVEDFGEDPDDPLAAYRVQMHGDGSVVAPPVRLKPPRFIALAPAAHGDSLQLRFEPPVFGPPTCQSRGLLASRIDGGGQPLSAESRASARASAWGGGYLAVDRLADDTFVAAYSTCQKFRGVVARRLDAAGAPVGRPLNLQLPGTVGNFAGTNLVVAAGGSDLAVAAMVSSPRAGASGAYIEAVVGNKVMAPIRLKAPLNIASVVDLEASPAGGYLLLFQGVSSTPLRSTLFAQQLNERGVPQGTPLAVTGPDELARDGAVASLPNGRWLVIARAQNGDPDDCREQLKGIVLAGG
jgi:hypothetical protein